jgi:hypothetical protein
MIVDLPEPDGPTKAVVFPASKTHEKFFKTCKSYREGYLKLTFENTISPLMVSFSI